MRSAVIRLGLSVCCAVVMIATAPALAQSACPNLSGLYLCPPDRATGAPAYRLEITQDHVGRASVLRLRSPGTTAHNGLIRIDGQRRAWPSGDDAVGQQLVTCEDNAIVQRITRLTNPAMVWRTIRYSREGDVYRETVDGAVQRNCRALAR